MTLSPNTLPQGILLTLPKTSLRQFSVVPNSLVLRTGYSFLLPPSHPLRGRFLHFPKNLQSGLETEWQVLGFKHYLAKLFLQVSHLLD